MRQITLYRRFGVKVMGLQHQGQQRVQGLRSQRLEVGDVLLLRGKPAGLQTAAETCRLLLVEGVENSLVRKTKNTTALIIMGLVILLASVTEIPIVLLSLAGVVAMIVTRCLRTDEAVGCLLYTSDAADERSSVDLGGRRIIKKKTIRALGALALLDLRHKNSID